MRTRKDDIRLAEDSKRWIQKPSIREKTCIERSKDSKEKRQRKTTE